MGSCVPTAADRLVHGQVSSGPKSESGRSDETYVDLSQFMMAEKNAQYQPEREKKKREVREKGDRHAGPGSLVWR